MASFKTVRPARMAVAILPDSLSWIRFDEKIFTAGSIPIALGVAETGTQIHAQQKLWVVALKRLTDSLGKHCTTQFILPPTWVRAYRTIHLPTPALSWDENKLRAYLRQFDSTPCLLKYGWLQRHPPLLECFYLEGAALYLWWKSCQMVKLNVVDLKLVPELWRLWLQAYAGDRVGSVLMVSHHGGGLMVSASPSARLLRFFELNDFERQCIDLFSKLLKAADGNANQFTLFSFQTDQALHAQLQTLPYLIQTIPTQIPKSLRMMYSCLREPSLTWELLWWFVRDGCSLDVAE